MMLSSMILTAQGSCSLLSSHFSQCCRATISWPVSSEASLGSWSN